jgi:hypothetical protein
MASYAELQPMPPEWPEPLRLELPDAGLRRIAFHLGRKWLGALVELAVTSGHPAASELLGRVATRPHRIVVEFCIDAATLDDPPTTLVRWMDEDRNSP